MLQQDNTLQNQEHQTRNEEVFFRLSLNGLFVETKSLTYLQTKYKQELTESLSRLI
jgi:hypothetical protein